MCAGIVVCFASWDLPQLHGDRLAAAAALLVAFGFAALPLTYLLSFVFQVAPFAQCLLFTAKQAGHAIPTCLHL